MTDLEILEEVKKIIESELGIPKDTIEEDSNLEEDLSIEELELEDLLSKIEEKYDLKIPTEKVSTFKKISDIVDFIYENIDTGV